MSVSSHYSFILSMTEEVSFMRFGKHATPQMGSTCVCVYNPVVCFEAESSGDASRGEQSSNCKLVGAGVCHALTLNPVEELGTEAFTEYMITPKSLYGFRDLRSVKI